MTKRRAAALWKSRFRSRNAPDAVSAKPLAGKARRPVAALSGRAVPLSPG